MNDLDPKQKKRSGNIALVIMGLVGAYAALPMCSTGTEYSRNYYNNREDCEQDYPASDCYRGTAYGSGYHYYGPYYRSDPVARLRDSKDPGPGRTAQETNRVSDKVVRVEKSTRGGFGSSARRYGVSS